MFKLRPKPSFKGAEQFSNKEIYSKLPKDFDAEKGLLGAIIVDNELIHEVSNTLSSEAFFLPANQFIYECMLDLSKKNSNIDELIISNWMKEKNIFDQIGGFEYLLELIDSVPTSGNISYYAKIINEKFLLRNIVSLANELGHDATNNKQGVSELINSAVNKINDISVKRDEKSFSHIKDVLLTGFEKIEKNSSNEDPHISGIKTEFDELDNILHGLQNSDLIILAARPAMGKTAFSLNLVKNIAKRGKTCVFFSLEMSEEQIGHRLLSLEAKIPISKIKSGDLEPQEWDSLALGMKDICSWPIYIDDRPSASPYQITPTIKQIEKIGGKKVDMIVIDYLQIMKIKSMSHNREQEISEISRTLKAIAKELDIPVIALSQLNRSLENRSDKKPILSDMRESGALEQDADIVIMIYRDEVYNKDSPDQGIAELLIRKHRNGSTGDIRLGFNGKYTKFSNIQNEYSDSINNY